MFRNAGSFRQADLEAVAQVHGGEKVTQKQMQDAAQHLIDTGFFEDVNVDSKGGPAGLTLIFILKQLPPDQVTKVEFENFIWFTPDELREIVHKVVPLFHGELPESGASLAQIDAALQSAVAEKGATGAAVEHEAVMATSAEPVHTLRFRVTKPAVLVNSVRLDGVDPALAPDVNRRATTLRGTPYEDGAADDSTLGRLLAPYRNAGYLQAKLSDVQIVVAKTLPNAVAVDVSAKVDAGVPFRVKAVSFADSPLVSASSFVGMEKLHPGDVASRKSLLETLALVEAACEKQGYADAYVDTAAEMDAAAHTVHYKLTVVPGEQYRLRSVDVEGLPPEPRAQFDAGWLLKPGDLYDPGYVRAFLTNNTALRGLAGYAGAFKAISDPQTHQVDLMITFVGTNGKG